MVRFSRDRPCISTVRAAQPAAWSGDEILHSAAYGDASAPSGAGEASPGIALPLAAGLRYPNHRTVRTAPEQFQAAVADRGAVGVQSIEPLGPLMVSRAGERPIEAVAVALQIDPDGTHVLAPL